MGQAQGSGVRGRPKDTGAPSHAVARGNKRHAAPWDDREWKAFVKVLGSVVGPSKRRCEVWFSALSSN
jgi:hypothetical protein